MNRTKSTSKAASRNKSSPTLTHNTKKSTKPISHRKFTTKTRSKRSILARPMSSALQPPTTPFSTTLATSLPSQPHSSTHQHLHTHRTTPNAILPHTGINKNKSTIFSSFRHTQKKSFSTSGFDPRQVRLVQFSDDDEPPSAVMDPDSQNHSHNQQQQQKDPSRRRVTRLGEDTYFFDSASTISSRYSPDPTQQSRSDEFDESNIPEEADSLDIINMLRDEQRIELERKLTDVYDDHERSFIIYQSALTFQQRLGKLRNIRREQKRILAEQVKTGLDNIKATATQLSGLDLISLLQDISVGDPLLKVYTLDHISQLHDYMLFFSCRDQTHLSFVANAVVDFVSTHPKFNSNDSITLPSTPDQQQQEDQSAADIAQSSTGGIKAVSKTSKRANLIQGKALDRGVNNKVEFDPDDPKRSGRKFGELLIFSRHDLPWRVIDLGSVLVHLSYGPERRLTEMESVLNQYVLNTDSKQIQKSLASTKLHKCLEITPVSQLEEDAMLKPELQAATDAIGLPPTGVNTGTEGQGQQRPIVKH